MRTCSYVLLAGGVAAMLTSCGKDPLGPRAAGCATVNVSATIAQPAALAKAFGTAETTWDSLVIRVSAPDMAPVRRAFALATVGGVAQQSVSGVAAGTNRLIEAWTVDKAGDTIHGVAGVTRSFQPNEIVNVQLTLNPARGSIYVSLTNFPASVDSVYAGFIAVDGRAWQSKVKRATRVNVSLDNIPYGTQGRLVVAGLSATGDTVAAWYQNDFVFTNENTTLQASFVSVGNITVTVTTPAPAVTLITGVMDTADSLDPEQTGPDSLLIVSEFMFTGGSGSSSVEYIELYNPSPAAVTLDTLILDVSGTTKVITKVSVPQGGFFVIGNTATPAQWNVNAAIGLDLVSTSGWITLMRTRKDPVKPGVIDTIVVDRVVYDNDQQVEGWPQLSSSAKTAIVLDSLTADPLYNNYGKHWVAAATPMTCNGVTYNGTPGKAGR